MLGKNSIYAEECYNHNFIGADFGIQTNLKNKLPDSWRDFNKVFIPIYLENKPGKSRIAAGLACGSLWTISKGIHIGDIVLSPNGKGEYYVGEIKSEYYYEPNKIQQHRRNVEWYPVKIKRNDMSEALQKSTGVPGKHVFLRNYSEEIEELIGGKNPRKIFTRDTSIESPSEFALEKHLEEFLIANWDQTVLSEKYNIYQEDGELVGQQYPSDTGPIDILCLSHDKKELLVIELKRGRASDSVVGQIQRYMGFVKEELAEDGQVVKGIIISLEDSQGLKRALSVTSNIEFYKYQIQFNLHKEY